jgi:hypothetical protein
LVGSQIVLVIGLPVELDTVIEVEDDWFKELSLFL